MMDKHDDKMESKEIISKVAEIVCSESTRDKKLEGICRLLADSVSYYDWIGFYLVDAKKKVLTLGPFIGEPTEHTRISFGQGICGQAAATGKPFVVQDVRKETNYLSCSIRVMSEIVVPILKDGEVIGVLNIDSHTLSPFTEQDVNLLEATCNLVTRLF